MSALFVQICYGEIMKKLSTYLLLIFFSFSVPTYADDVRDFEIEGISIGDSLLDHFSKNEIKNFIITTYHKNTDEYIMLTGGEDKSQEYENLSLHVKKNDNQNYKIASIGCRFKNWISYHGFSINHNPTLEHYSGINPCGLNNKNVTSIEDLGKKISKEELNVAIKENILRMFKI